MIAHHRLEPLVEHVGVDLRRCDVGVSEHLLHRAKIGAVREQVARERVAQYVGRRAARLDPGRRREFFQELREAVAEVHHPRWTKEIA